MTPETLDPSALAHLREITGGDLGFVDELIDTFLDDATAQLDDMRQAASAGDAARMVRPAHSLKSTSANVGAMALAELCRSLEADGRSGTIVDATARVDACELAFAEVRTALLDERTTR